MRRGRDANVVHLSKETVSDDEPARPFYRITMNDSLAAGANLLELAEHVLNESSIDRPRLRSRGRVSVATPDRFLPL
jgi:hypothetical protein